MAQPIPPKVRDYIIERVGSWPKTGDINYPIEAAVNAFADYIDMIVARVIGEDVESVEAVAGSDLNRWGETLRETLVGL